MTVGFNLTKDMGAMKIESLEDYNGTIFETGALKLIWTMKSNVQNRRNRKASNTI